MKKIIIVLGLSAILAASVLAEEPAKKEEPKKEAAKETATQTKKAEETTMKDTTAAKEAPWTTTESGLKWRDKVVGEGATAAMQMPVTCHYTVWLADTDGNKGKFVQSSKGGEPFQCTIGVRLIKGWSEGMVGMKEGGVRELIVHPAIGYGNQAMGDMIPANSTLYFEIEFVKEVKK